MTIPYPDLDDRDFEALMARAAEIVRASQTPWNDLNPGDPGVVLLEVFAHLTEILIYRVNRVPESARLELLRLLNLAPGPPAAAAVSVVLRAEAPTGPVEVEAGSQVEAAGESGEGRVVLITDHAATLTPERPEAAVIARHCRQVSGELLGRSTGQPGQRFHLAAAPVVSPTGAERDLLIAVEVGADGAVDSGHGLEIDGRAFEIWPVVETFATTAPAERAVLVDRWSGAVTFAPAVRLPRSDGGVASAPTALAAVPPAGREIRAWYRHGGGAAGNIAPGTVIGLVGGPAGVTAGNPGAGLGGRDPETLDQALTRAGHLFHEPRRAITADDFEALAERHGAVARALAVTSAEQWAHATPGTVEVHLVPTDLDVVTGSHTPAPTTPTPSASAPTTPATRGEGGESAAGTVLDEVRAELEARQPLGVRTTVGWVGVKRVSISLTVVVSAGEDPESVRRRVVERLRATLDPLPSPGRPGWPFGQALRASNIYDAALREPGVHYAEAVRIEVDEAPDRHVTVVAADRHQPSTWYAAADGVVFRSEDDGAGWEPIWRSDGGEVVAVVPAADRPGRVAVVSVVPESGTTTALLHVSDDCGSTFGPAAAVAFTWTDGEAPHRINDTCWLPAGHDDDLLLATDRGLYRYRASDRVPVPLEGAPTDSGFWAVAVAPHSSTEVTVVAARKGSTGLVIGGAGGSGGAGRFVDAGVADVDIRRLVIEERGTRRFVWAPIFVEGDNPGSGCLRAELPVDGVAALRWSHLRTGWSAGSCRGLALHRGGAVAASEFNGILWRPDGEDDTPWRSPRVYAGLPLREDRRFERIWSVAADGERVMAATDLGLFVTETGGHYLPAASRTSSELVTIPRSWLFVNGDHQVTVRSGAR